MVLYGVNSRLDTIQAAILLEKLKVFPDEIEKRDVIAKRYDQLLGRSNKIRLPRLIEGAQSTWAQYTIQVPDRDKVQISLKAQGIPTAVYYPIPLSRQKGYREFPAAATPVSENLSKTVISLPMHPYLDDATLEVIATGVLAAV